MAGRLIELLPKGLSVRSALDVGCATGTVAGELSTRFPTAHITALDISSAMLIKAKERQGNGKGLVSYVASDFEELPFIEGTFDLVLSNLSYQWADSLTRALEELYRVLAPGGLVLMNTLARGTLDELRQSFSEAEESLKISQKRPFIPFVEPSTLRKHIVDSSLEVVSFEQRSYIREYPGMRELLRVLKKIGAVNPLSRGGANVMSASLLRAAEENYKLRFGAVDSDGVTATYNTIFILAKKAV